MAEGATNTKAPDRGYVVWAWNRRLGRLALSLAVYHHSYPASADRWVFLPRIVYDRKNG